MHFFKALPHSIFIVVVLACVSACQKPTTHMPQPSQQQVANEERIQQEMVRGKKVRIPVSNSTTVTKAMEARLNRVYPRVLRASAAMCRDLGIPMSDERCNPNLQVDKKQQLNAYADGKMIHITPAMIRFAEADDELAYILAHEISHNMMEHVDATKTNVMAGNILGMLIDAAASSQGYSTGGTFGEIGSQAAMLSYSPEFEHEADYIGMFITARAGYNYRNTANVWRRMSIEEPDNIYTTTTHPANAARFAQLQETIREIDTKVRNKRPLVPEFRPQ